jgi:2-methylcitrate dehydratase PrpD
VSFRGKKFAFQRPYGSYVMEQILFKLSFPAEFHAQTAVEACVRLHADVRGRLDEIDSIVITTHESAIRIISKQGELRNPADRDHCLQYMCAIALLKGDLTALDYEDSVAADPRIDALRAKMVVQEDPDFSREYHEPSLRSIANAVQVRFKDGGATERVEIHFPIGHKRRRAEGLPVLRSKFERNVAACFGAKQTDEITQLFADVSKLDEMPVDSFVDRLVLART